MPTPDVVSASNQPVGGVSNPDSLNDTQPTDADSQQPTVSDSDTPDGHPDGFTIRGRKQHTALYQKYWRHSARHPPTTQIVK